MRSGFQSLKAEGFGGKMLLETQLLPASLSLSLSDTIKKEKEQLLQMLGNNSPGVSLAKQHAGGAQLEKREMDASCFGSHKHSQGLVSQPALGNEADRPQECPEDGGACARGSLRLQGTGREESYFNLGVLIFEKHLHNDR